MHIQQFFSNIWDFSDGLTSKSDVKDIKLCLKMTICKQKYKQMQNNIKDMLD